MASGIYNRFKYDLMRGYNDLGTEQIKCTLLTSSHSFNADQNFWAQISANEVAGTGNYTTGGSLLTAKTVTKDDTNDRAAFDAADLTWANSTITAHFAVLYNMNTSTNDLIACFDFGSDYSSSSGNFTIQWHADGIILLT